MSSLVRSLSLAGIAGASLWAAAPAAAGEGDAGTPLAPVRANESFTMNALLGYVNSRPMFVGDMLRPIDDDLRRMARQARDVGDFRREARSAIESQMRRQVSEVLIHSAAKAALTDEDKQRVEIFLNKQRFELLSKYGGSQAMADQALRAIGSSVEKDMEDKRRQLIVEMYLHKQLWPRVVVTRQMVLEDYEKDPKKWTQEAEIELFTLTLPVARFLHEPTTTGTKGPLIANPTAEQIANARSATLALARELIARFKKGEDWARLAEDNSVDSHAQDFGGRWPKVRKGSMANEEAEKRAFALSADTVGEPLLIEDKNPAKSAVMVIRVGQKKDAQTVSFADAQDEIRNRLREQQYHQLSDAYMAKLYRDAAVEAVDRMVDVAVDAAVARYATGTEGK
jgi:hypothetical protein